MRISSENKIQLEIKNLNVRYNTTIAVEDFSVSMNNETIVLFGPSGCGKTTILKSILGINESGKKVEGSININNIELDSANGDIGMTFQGPVLPNWLKVSELCSIGSNIRKCSDDKKFKKINDILKTFNIEQHQDKYPSELSGGEKQRVALAVTLINEPRILLLDEPTTFIDGVTRLTIWKHIENHIRPLQIPTIIVSHDPMEALVLADRILILGTNAKIIKEIKVEFKHPRSEELFKTDEFWELKSELDGE